MLLRLATHYNQSVSELLGYFFRELKEIPDFAVKSGLIEVLEELYEEHLLPLAIPAVVRQLERKELESWLLHLLVSRRFSGIQEKKPIVKNGLFICWMNRMNCFALFGKPDG